MRFPTGALLTLAAFAFAADPPTFHSKVSLVKADVYVYDRRSGAAILDLSADDFRVFDGNEPRTITNFGNEAVPLDLVFLLDVSGSVRETLSKVSDSAVAALSVLDEHDRASVMAFSKKTVLTQSLTNDAHAVARGIRAATSIQIGLDTDINQAVWTASDYLHDSRGDARRAVLILTDNMQETHVPDSLVDEQLADGGVILSGFLLRGPITLPHVTRPGILGFARNTGGEIIEGNQPAARLAEMIRRIKLHYSIHFRPVETGSAKPRNIRIELGPSARARHPKAAIRSRRIYYPQGHHRPRPQIPDSHTIALLTQAAHP
jgi:hypothetical protein